MAALSRPAVPPTPTFRAAGFTLTEMAVVLVIAALLIGGLMLPLSAQRDIRIAAETQQLLAEVGEALYGFAASHAADDDGKPYLPCPDTDGDGLENRDAFGSCTSQDGNLPWGDLGLGRRDAWGNPVRYSVTATFSNKKTGFTLALLGTGGDRRVCLENDCDPAATVLAKAVPAVFLSRGKNGAVLPTDADEQENADADNDFVQHDATSTFDDLVAWLPSAILANRTIAAGRLP